MCYRNGRHMIFGFNVGSVWAYHLYIITIMTWVWDGYVHGLYMGPRWVFRKNNYYSLGL